MNDIMSVYDVTDRFGIDREEISIPLEKEGTGDIRRHNSGLEIVVPKIIETDEWLLKLEAELQQLGFEIQNDDDSWT